jgi:predicted nucleotidyltransferase
VNRIKHGLPAEVVRKITAVLAQYPQVKSATLYGSRAKGNYKTGSDIDLTLHGEADLTLNVVYRILDHLDDLFLPYTIDLSIFHDIADSDVVEHIQRVGVSFYEREFISTSSAP